MDEDRALAFLDRVTEASRSAQRQMNDDDSFKKRPKKRDYDGPTSDGDAVDEKPRRKFAGAEEEEARVVEEAAEVSVGAVVSGAARTTTSTRCHRVPKSPGHAKGNRAAPGCIASGAAVKTIGPCSQKRSSHGRQASLSA